jgi:hypothetical protein
MNNAIKRPLFVIILTMMAIGIKAQPYKLFIPNTDYFYNGKGFKIIRSEIDKNGDSIYYSIPEEYLYTNDSDKQCIKAKTFSWISPKIIAKPNGINILFNLNHDSIVLKSRASVNDKWICYKNKKGDKVEAAITHDTIMLFLGIIDSVKVITLKFTDKNNSLIPSILNSSPIIISKNYGLVQTPNFVCFPDVYVLSNVPLRQDMDSLEIKLGIHYITGFNNTLGEKNIKSTEVFDFQPGDEFDIYERIAVSALNVQYFTKLFILKRNENSNSINYQYHLITKRYSMWQSKDTIYSDTTYFANITKEDSNFNRLPGILYNDNFPQSYSYKAPYMIDSSKFFPITNANLYNLTNGSCYTYVHVDGGADELEYKIGFGGPYYSYYNDGGHNERSLKYYKKGDKTWGTPFSDIEDKTVNNQPQVSVYPNPWSSQSSISINSTSEGNVFIYSNLGKQLSSMPYKPGYAVINLERSNYTPGMYFFLVVPESGNPVAKKFVVE